MTVDDESLCLLICYVFPVFVDLYNWILKSGSASRLAEAYAEAARVRSEETGRCSSFWPCKASIKIRQILSLLHFVHKIENARYFMWMPEVRNCHTVMCVNVCSNILGKLFEVFCLALLILNKKPLLVSLCTVGWARLFGWLSFLQLLSPDLRCQKVRAACAVGETGQPADARAIAWDLIGPLCSHPLWKSCSTSRFAAAWLRDFKLAASWDLKLSINLWTNIYVVSICFGLLRGEVHWFQQSASN